MTLTLYSNASEYAALDKELTEVVSLTGALREESSIIDPIVTVEGLNSYLTQVNYAYIPEFGRYYFITNIQNIRTNLWKIYLHVDVLHTYAAAIRENSAIIERNENEYDLQLNDGLFKTRQNPRIVQYPFPAGFTTWNFVLAVAGN